MMTMTRTQWSNALVAAALVSSSACAATVTPVRARTDAAAAVRAARELGAGDTPQAALHMALAEEGVAEGEALIRDGQMESAERALLRAHADAELAMALRREAMAQTQAAESHDHVEEQRESAIGPDAKEAS